MVDEPYSHEEEEPFKGNNYLRLTSGRGLFVRQAWNKVAVRVRYNTTSSVTCPFEEICCKFRTRVGTFGRHGDGQRFCTHLGSGTQFLGTSSPGRNYSDTLGRHPVQDRGDSGFSSFRPRRKFLT